MHAYLIVGVGKDALKEKVNELAKKLKAKTLDFSLVKIEDVRNLNSFTNLKVIEPTAITINSIESATPEALNAFLKNLEEPQEDLYYILTTESVHKVLPTIVSRCQVIKVESTQYSVQSTEIERFLKMTVGEKLAFVDQIRDREVAKSFTRDLIGYLHESLHKDPENLDQKANNLEVAQKTLDNLLANGNVALQLANLVIKLNSGN